MVSNDGVLPPEDVAPLVTALPTFQATIFSPKDDDLISKDGVESPKLWPNANRHFESTEEQLYPP